MWNPERCSYQNSTTTQYDQSIHPTYHCIHSGRPPLFEPESTYLHRLVFSYLNGKIGLTYLIQMAGTWATAKAAKMIWRSKDIAIRPWIPFPSIVHCSRMLFSSMLYRSISWNSTVCSAEGSKAFDFITSGRSKGSGTCQMLGTQSILLSQWLHPWSGRREGQNHQSLGIFSPNYVCY